jgi:vacuolar iron transporter family protein
MLQILHSEHHFTGSATMRDLVIGMSDGLTVPFALAAGLAGAVDATRIIVTAALSEYAGSLARVRGPLERAAVRWRHQEALPGLSSSVLTRRPGRAQYGAAGTAGS